jgi:hypothetical protein
MHIKKNEIKSIINYYNIKKGEREREKKKRKKRTIKIILIYD